MSLARAANRWLRNEPAGSIITWETLKMKFLRKYCPHARTAKKMKEINNFQQEPDKTLYQTWERFKELLLRCAQHYLMDMQEVILFYKGLDVPTRQILDSKGAMPSMKAADAKKAIQDMADHSQKWHIGTSTRTRSTDTCDGLATIQAQLNDLGREIKKVNEKVYATQVGCESCGGPHYTKDCPLKEDGKTLEEAYYTQFGVPFPQGGRYRAAALGFYQRDNGNPSYQERRQTIEESLSKFMVESAKRHDENSNLIKERATNLKMLLKEKPRMGYQIEASMKVHNSAILEDYLPPKEKDQWSFTIPCHINNICFEKALANLGASVSVMPYSTFTNLDMLEDIKVPLILERPFLSTAYVKIDVFKRKITLRVGDDKIMFKSDNPTSNIIKRVYVLELRERMECDLEARLMGEALILNRSLIPMYGDYIKVNDLNEPIELRRNQVEELGLTIEDGEIINEHIVKTRNDDEEIEGIDEYPSFCDFDRKIHIDCVFNLQFSCMIGFEHVNANFLLILSINAMSKRFYNSIMKDIIEYKGKIFVGAFMNVPIFVGNFSVVTNFAVVENIDAYRHHDMGEVIVGKSFCREICVKARQFDGMITIYNGNDSVTYQMA
ncbi:ribonuclease H-like domain, reverse transcriptase, RNA-dependent DNA polymerase [Tanacetum coccineum]